MPLITTELWINAPIERVFDLARSIDVHSVSQNHRKERAVGGRTSGLIEVNETVTWVAKHLGIMQNLTARIPEMNRPFYFKDEMVKGAFKTMAHDHYFNERDGGTLLSDKLYFEAPFGIIGKLFSEIYLKNYMKTFLSERNETIKKIAESDEWVNYLKSK